MNKTPSGSVTTLVVGRTGKTGRRVAERLSASGVPVRVGSRSSDPSLDWGDEATWEPALRDADAAYLTSSPDLGLPDAAERVRRFAGLAVGRGARSLVLLAGRGQHGHLPAERAVQEPGAEWTIVRAAGSRRTSAKGS